jgi:membrane protein
LPKIRGRIVKQWQIVLAGLAALALTGARRRMAEQQAGVPASRRGFLEDQRGEWCDDSRGARGKPGQHDSSGGDKPDPNAGDASSGERISPERGRLADHPGEIPKQGWRDVLLRVKSQIGEDNVSLTAAGVAYGWLLAIFPLLGSLISIYGLVADPAEVQRQVEPKSFRRCMISSPS